MKRNVIVAISVIAVLVLCVFIIQDSQNGAIFREEQVQQAQSDITVQYKRRADLLVNLADAIKSYNNHEAEVLIGIAQGRTPEGKDGDINASAYIKAVAERYPELKSEKNYENYMIELALTENKIAQVRENFNYNVKEYKRYTRKFPTSTILNMLGYEVIDFKYLDYQISEESPKNLL
ncbi:MAG: LemA family protein [Fibrobacter sp.]|nr:LemA family protein [Fibrobacter sp.]